MKTRAILLELMLLPLFCATGLTAQTANPQDTLNQYVAELQKDPENAALRAKTIAFAQTITPAPEIPEDARHHYIRGSVFAKEAKTDAEYESAIQEYVQALYIAPWWGNAYYGLAMVQKTSGQFDAAVANLKLALLAKMEEKDVKEAQDQIYAIEVEKELATKRTAEAQAAADQQQAEANWNQLTADLASHDKDLALAGPWACASGCTGASLTISNGSLSGSISYSLESGDSHSAGINASVTNGAVDGQAAYSAFDVGPCTIPASSQALYGTVSDDGRSMTLKTTYLLYQTQTQGLIFTTCVSVNFASSQAVQWVLNSQAAPSIPILAVTQAQSSKFLHVGQLEAIKLILAHGGNINTVDGSGMTALHIASQQSNKDVVALLLENGAQINAESKSLDTPLSFALDSGSIDTVQVLLDHGAKPDTRPNSIGFTPLYKAVWQGNTDIAARLLKNTTDPAQVTVALYFITDKNLEITKLLLARGANVNITGTYNATPLDVALVRGCGDAYAGIWSKRPQDVKDSPCTPTSVTQTVTLLLEHGAKVDMPEINGVYPLMRAAETGNLDLVKLLLAHGADINVRDYKGHTVLEYAKEGRGTQMGFASYKRTAGNEEVIKYFEGLGLKKK
ncbi:MAG: ankyrin repeat domain-containing protein [Terracidiphilus sp.]|jgi:ankyrin repeat protein